MNDTRPLHSMGRPNAIRITIGTEYENDLAMKALRKALD